MKKNTRLVTFVLCLIMLLTATVSCARENDNGDITTTTTSNQPHQTTLPEVTTLPTDENGYLLDDLPSELNYNKSKVKLLHWNDAPFVDFESEMSADIVTNAVYERNLNVEERLGVTLEFIGIPGNSSNKQSYLNTVKSSVLSGIGEYDIMAAHSLVGQGLILENLLCDLKDTEYINLDKPWWPSQLISAATIHNKLYFASGDISTNMLWYMTVMFYNVDLAKEFGVEDLHTVVLDGKWTLAKMEQVITDTYVDKNSNSIKDSGDTFGFYTAKTPIDTFLYGSGITVIEHDDAGNAIISDEFGSEKTIRLCERLCTMLFDTNDAMTSSENNSANFAAGDYMLYFNYAHNAASSFREVSFGMSVLPCPKYDEAQENYITTESFSYSIYMISRDAKESSMSSAVIEALASEGYRTTTPAVFEISLKSKYALNDKTAKVYDIIKSNICFDLGRLFGANLDNNTHVAFRNAVAGNNRAWATVYAGIKTSLETKLKELF